MEFYLKENIPGSMIFIDFQKAFNSLEWNFLFSCLEAFGFGPEFIWWVRTLYHNIESCVINNGLATDFFSLERDVRQGDPLSPYLFVVAVETLALALKSVAKKQNSFNILMTQRPFCLTLTLHRPFLTFSKYSRTYQDL